MRASYSAAVAPKLPISVLVPVTDWHHPLALAALCINCESLFDIRNVECPACTSAVNLNLADVLA